MVRLWHSADPDPTGPAAVEEMGSATFLAAWVAQDRSQSQTVGAALTNAAIRGVLKIYYQTYWYFRGAADLDLVAKLVRLFL